MIITQTQAHTNKLFLSAFVVLCATVGGVLIVVGGVVPGESYFFTRSLLATKPPDGNSYPGYWKASPTISDLVAHIARLIASYPFLLILRFPTSLFASFAVTEKDRSSRVVYLAFRFAARERQEEKLENCEMLQKLRRKKNFTLYQRGTEAENPSPYSLLTVCCFFPILSIMNPVLFYIFVPFGGK